MSIARNLAETTTTEVQGLTYTLATLPNRMMLAITELGQAAQTEVLVRFGVASWSGLKGKDGVAVECARESLTVHNLTGKALDEASFDALPVMALGELSAEVFRINTLSGDEVGN